MPERHAHDTRNLPSFVVASGDDCILTVRVVPRSGRTAVAGDRAGALLVRLAAAPVDGAANDALIEFLAARLGVAKRSVTLVAGDRARDKRVRVAGLPASAAAARLAGSI